MLACWLAISPLIFHGPAPPAALWFEHLTAALLVMTSASVSYWPLMRHAHLASVLCGGWLVLHYYTTSTGEGTPIAQNAILTGLMILMFAIIPNRASRPPAAWSRLNEQITGNA